MPLSPLHSWLLILTGGALLVALVIEIAKNERDKNDQID